MKIQELSVSERILLVEEIWDSILDQQSQVNITPEQRDELDRRLAAYDLDGDLGSSWDEVKARIRKNA